MPADLIPKVWWINVGLFDLARHECSAQVVLLGILRIVEEIRNKKPDAFIVIGGILPASTFNVDAKTKKKKFQRLKIETVVYLNHGRHKMYGLILPS